MSPRDQRSESALYLVADELMSSPAIATSATASVRDAARLMRDRGVGALPVLDDASRPIGMVSDGDLLRHLSEGGRRDWWLDMLASGAPPQVSATDLDKPVREVMSTPLISVSPRASVQEIAEAMQAHRIKRLPVIADGRLIGIVSRADLMCVVESVPHAPQAALAEGEGHRLLGFLESLIGGTSLRGVRDRQHEAALPEPHEERQSDRPAAPALSAAAFRDAVRAYKAETFGHQQAQAREAQLERRRQIKALLDHHVSEELWREMLEHAELAAKNGAQEVMMLRFPSDLCSDGGRKIDVAERGWEETLRGEAAELYVRWKTELKPRGFGLSARIVSYEDGGTIGDIGLYLTWGGAL
jgi:CBS domain-containing protein